MADFPSIFAPAQPPLDPRLLAPRGVIAPPGPPPAAYAIPGITPRSAPSALAPKMPGPVIAPPTAPDAPPGAVAAPTAAPRASVGPIMPPGVLTPPDAMATGPKLADFLGPRRIEIGAAPEAEPPNAQAAVDQAKAAESAIKPPQYHGKLGVLEKIGDAASRLLAPGIEQRLGVGTIGYEDRLANAQTQTDRAEKEAAQESANRKNEADAAEAQRLANEPPKEAAPEQQAYDALRSQGVAPLDAMRQVVQAAAKPSASHFSPVVGTVNGKQAAGLLDSSTGHVVGLDGQPITGFTLAQKQGTDHYQPMFGTVNGKTVPALFDSATGQYLDPSLQPITGFTPQQNKPMSPIEGAMLVRSLLNEGYRSNPAILQAAADVAKGSGLPFTPGDLEAIATIPAAQPTDENGTPIGLSQPSAPTTSMRNQAQYSEGVLDQLGPLENDVHELEKDGKIGPVSGRWVEFMTGRIGADDPAFAKMRADRDNLVMAWSKAHGINTDQARAQIGALLTASQSGGNVTQALESIRRYARFYAQRGSGNGAAGNAPGDGYAPGDKRTYNGATYVFKGGDPTQKANWEKQ